MNRLITLMMLFLGATTAIAQTEEKEEVEEQVVETIKQKDSNERQAQIEFETTSIDFGTFSEKEPVQTCTFKFKNTGNAPLVIHQAMATCGCTVPTYPKEPIMPGEEGEINVRYNGKGKFPGQFRKSIVVRTNAAKELVRLRITGDMTPSTD